MNFEEKYLKYKAKYIHLKNEYDLSVGGDLLQNDTRDRDMILFKAIDTCDLKLVEEKLLEKDENNQPKNNPDDVHYEGDTPLIYVLKSEKLKECNKLLPMFELLLKYGAKLESLIFKKLFKIDFDNKSLTEIVIPIVKKLIDANFHIKYTYMDSEEGAIITDKLALIYTHFKKDELLNKKYIDYIFNEYKFITHRNKINLSFINNNNDKNNLLQKLSEYKYIYTEYEDVKDLLDRRNKEIIEYKNTQKILDKKLHELRHELIKFGVGTNFTIDDIFSIKEIINRFTPTKN
jgi:hypothetical protein